jgi:hypothetical protein
MGDGALTKQQLDELTAAWRADCAAAGYPVDTLAPVAKALTTEVKARDRAIIEAVMAAVAPFIHALEQRVAELEASTLKYCGVYQPSASYQRGNVVTCDGSAFHATRSVSAERPGSTDAWQLMVKHGKDAPTASPRSDTATAHARNGSASGPPVNPRLR